MRVLPLVRLLASILGGLPGVALGADLVAVQPESPAGQPAPPAERSPLWREAEAAAARSPGLAVRISSEAARVGEPVMISVEIPRAGHLNVISIGPDGVATLLFPNRLNPDNRVSVGTLTIPTPQMRSQLRITPPFGRNLVTAFLSRQALDFSPLAAGASLREILAQPTAAVPSDEVAATAGEPGASIASPDLPTLIAGTAQVLTCGASGPCGPDDGDYGDRPDLMAAGIFLDPEERGVPQDFGPLRPVYRPGLEMTQTVEGFVPHLYNDASHYCTVAYGHLVATAPCNGQEPAEFRRGVTPEQGSGLLANDMVRAQRAVLAAVQVSLSDGQYAALCDFTYNVGARHLRTSGLLRAVNSMDLAAVEAQFMRWVMAGGKVRQGLVERRRRELALFFEGLPRRRGMETAASEPPLDIRDGESAE